MDLKLKWNERISEISSADETFKIKGVAISSTTTANGHTFIEEELEKSAQTLMGVPLLKDHENIVDNIVGKVTESRFDFNTGSIMFEAVVVDRSMVEKIKLGLLDSVSIGAQVADLEENSEGKLIPRGIEFKELSLVAVPADGNATFGIALKQAYDSYSPNGVHELKGGTINMSEETQQVETPKEESKEEATETKEEVEEPKEEPKEAITEEKVKSWITQAVKAVKESDEDEKPTEAEDKEEPKETEEEEAEDEVVEEVSEKVDGLKIMQSHEDTPKGLAFEVVRNL